MHPILILDLGNIEAPADFGDFFVNGAPLLGNATWASWVGAGSCHFLTAANFQHNSESHLQISDRIDNFCIVSLLNVLQNGRFWSQILHFWTKVNFRRKDGFLAAFLQTKI